MSDESPMTGSDTCHPVDEAVIENAIRVATDHEVRVSPIIGQESGRDVCIPTLAERLALETGGTFTFTETADELADAVTHIVEEACRTAM